MHSALHASAVNLDAARRLQALMENLDGELQIKQQQRDALKNTLRELTQKEARKKARLIEGAERIKELPTIGNHLNAELQLEKSALKELKRRYSALRKDFHDANTGLKKAATQLFLMGSGWLVSKFTHDTLQRTGATYGEASAGMVTAGISFAATQITPINPALPVEEPLNENYFSIGLFIFKLREELPTDRYTYSDLIKNHCWLSLENRSYTYTQDSKNEDFHEGVKLGIARFYAQMIIELAQSVKAHDLKESVFEFIFFSVPYRVKIQIA